MPSNLPELRVRLPRVIIDDLKILHRWQMNESVRNGGLDLSFNKWMYTVLKNYLCQDYNARILEIIHTEIDDLKRLKREMERKAKEGKESSLEEGDSDWE